MATSTLIIFICIFICSPIQIGCLDNQNVTITWAVSDLVAENGYQAVIVIQNYYTGITFEEAGWQLSWWWTEKEIILGIVGATVVETGDCSQNRIQGIFPVSCLENPTVVDLPVGNNSQNQMPNCCKGGLLSNYIEGQLNSNSSSSFQLYVGNSGSRTGIGGLKKPKKFTLKAGGVEYICGPSLIVSPIGVLMKWSITCKYPLSKNNYAKLHLLWTICIVIDVLMFLVWMVDRCYIERRRARRMYMRRLGGE